MPDLYAALAFILGHTAAVVVAVHVAFYQGMAMLSNIMHALNVDANFIFQDEVREHHESHATPSEMDSLVKPYRALDEAGQKMVRTVIELEMARCKNVVPSLPVK